MLKLAIDIILKVRQLINNVHFNSVKQYKGALILVFERILRISTGLFLAFYIARLLGPIEYGKYSLILATVAILDPFIKMGLQDLLVRKLKEDNDNQNIYIISSLLISHLVAILAIIFAYVNLRYSQTTIAYFIFLFSFSLFFKGYWVFESYFFATQRNVNIARIRLVVLLISVLLKLLLILNDISLVKLLYVLLLENILLYFFYSYFTLKRTILFPLSYFRVGLVTSSLVKEGFPLFLVSFMAAIYSRIDQLMINSFLGNEQTGLYAACTKLGEVWIFIPVIIAQTSLSPLVEANMKSTSIFNNRLRTAVHAILIPSFLFTIIIAFNAEFFLAILFGASYSAAYASLVIIVITNFLASFGVLFNNLVLIAGLQRLNTYSVVIGTVVNLLLNLWLIPSYGILGAAYATLFSMIITVFIIPLMVPRLRYVILQIMNSIIC